MAPKPKSASQQKPKASASADNASKKAKSDAKGKGKAAPAPESAGVTSGQDADGATSGAASPLFRRSWPHTTLSESNASAHPAVYTPDAKYFFVISSSSVKVYSAATGLPVSTLSPRSANASSSSSLDNQGHAKPITALAIHPSNPLQLVTASLDGTLKIWDYIDAALLSTISVQRPVTTMCIDTSQPDTVFVTSPAKVEKQADDDDKRSIVWRVPLRQTNPESTVTYICKTQGIRSLATSPSGKWLVIAGYTKVYIRSLAPNSTGGMTRYNAPDPITCLAFHPTDDYFATGSTEGPIHLWYCLRSTGQLPDRTQTTMLHWHAHRVSALTFSPNGAYLLSGGEESVLVIWQMDANKKDFVPRVGAPIVSIAVTPAVENANEGYLLALADGSLIVIDAAAHKIRQEIPRLKLAPAHLRPSTTTAVPLAIHAASGTVVLPSSHPSCLQFYDPVASALTSELEVTPSNRVSRTQEAHAEPVRVLHAVTCPSGRWLATIDGRAGTIGSTCLKLWEWNGKAWSLNTRVDRPHGPGCVHSIAFNPAGSSTDSWQLVTIGEDRNVKTWKTRLVGGGPKVKGELFWLSRSTFSWRDCVPGQVSWARDGSLFAVTFDKKVVLFDPDTNATLQVLHCPEIRNIRAASFVGGSGQYFAVASANDLVVWDLVTAKVNWHYETAHEIESIIPHPTEDAFVVLQQPPRPSNKYGETFALEFSILSSRPRHKHIISHPLRAAAYFALSISASAADFTLIGITHKWAIVLCGDGVTRFEDGHAEHSNAIVDDGSGSRRTILQDIFGRSAILSATSRGTPIVAPLVPGAAKVAAPRDLELPPYEQPPLPRLFDALMGRIIGKRALDVPPIPNDADAMDVDDATHVEATAALPISTEEGPEIGQDELDALTALFRKALSAPTPASAAPVHHTNGNGVHKPSAGPSKPNMVTPKTKPQKLASPAKAAAIVDIEMADTESPPVVGRKRKKSQV